MSLSDYEDLKGWKDHYLDLAVKHVELLEEIEKFLNGEKIAPGLANKINMVLSEWYG